MPHNLEANREDGKINISHYKSLNNLSDMTNEELQAYLTGEFSKAEVKLGKQYVEILVQAADLHETAVRLKTRSEERRVGKACRGGWSPYH